jgi:hypothetical protein
MQRISDLSSANEIVNPAIRALVIGRIDALTDQGFALAEVGHFLVINATDTLAAIERHLGGPFSAYELIEDFPHCFDVVFLLDQSGKGIEVFVPKEEGIDADLIALCRMFAFSSPPEARP